MQPWKTLRRATLLDCGRFLKVENHVVELPNGRVIDDWSWVVTPDYVNVFVLTEDQRVLVFRQVKYSVQGETLAPVGGYMEPGEEPLAAARRELLEETGFSAPEWQSLGSYAVDGSRGCGKAFFFLARGAQQVAEPHADDLEEQHLLLLSPAETAAAVRAGEFKLLPWIAIMSLGLSAIVSTDTE